MFGKPHWFRNAKDRRGIVPICWQGWLWTVAWIIVVIIPVVALLGISRTPEALIWVAAVAVVLIWETHQIRSHLSRTVADEDVLYIGDEPEDSQVATQNYSFHLRQ